MLNERNQSQNERKIVMLFKMLKKNGQLKNILISFFQNNLFTQIYDI